MAVSTLLPSWPWLVAGTVGAVSTFVTYCNIPLAWKASPQKATLDWLSPAPLQKLGAGGATFAASDLWQKNGAVVMAVRRPG